jgi:Protein of unknown function (DUF3306)
MNDPENFLARWSRRKHAAATNDETKPSVAPSPKDLKDAVEIGRIPGTECQDGDGAGLLNAAHNAIDPPFDPLSLPPLESIAADTDIRGFLAAGVPPDLSRAALRRAWVADPKIRDFVGLADYDWDFNAPGSMAGFGSLEMTDELRHVAAQIIGQAPARDHTTGTPDPVAANTTSDQSSGEPDLMAQIRPIGHEMDHMEQARNVPGAEPAALSEADDLSPRDQQSSLAQRPSCKPEHSQLIVPLRHGGALPK